MVKSGLNHSKILQQVMLGSINYLTVIFLFIRMVLYCGVVSIVLQFCFTIFITALLFSYKTTILKDFLTLMVQNPIEISM